ncbi:MAG: hypothetical protein V1712_02590 [Patescibacteria group bacterium]
MPNLPLKNKVSGDDLHHTPFNQPNKKTMQTKVATKISTKVLLALGILVVGGGIMAALISSTGIDDRPILPSYYTLKVAKIGSGVVTSADGKINCVDNAVDSGCSATYKHGTAVTLTASPAKGFAFGSWSSNCQTTPGTVPVCTITLVSNQTVTATFKSLAPIVTTQPANVYGLYANLKGTVNPNGFNTLAWFRLSAVNPGSVPPSKCDDTFGGRLPGGTVGIPVGSGNLAVEIMTSVTDLRYSTTYYYCAIAQNIYGISLGQLLSFTTPPLKVTLVVKKVGGGTITSSPQGIDCGNYCSALFPAGTTVTLTATPAVGYKFSKWSTNCVPTPISANTCAITLRSDTISPYTVDATFIGLTPTATTKPADVYGAYAHLKGSVNPNGWETAAWFRYSAVSPGAAPPSTCNDTFGIRRPASGGMQIGRGTSFVDVMDGVSELRYSTTYYYCAIAQNTNGKSLGELLSFTTPAAPSTYTLSVTKIGGGSDEVYSNEIPPKIDCGIVCSASYQSGASVTLTAKPTFGHIFSGWSGDCSGTSTTCNLIMASNKNVTANFTAMEYILNVSKAGTGAGLVSSQPPGIYCGDDCNESYGAGVPVTLTVSNYQGESVFVGWSGACTGTSTTCNLVMDSNKSVTANFALEYALHVETYGAGYGTITSNPSGIICRINGGPAYPEDVCSMDFAGTVTLTAATTPDTGYRFVKWDSWGDVPTICAGSTSSTCVVTMNGIKTAFPVFGIK